MALKRVDPLRNFNNVLTTSTAFTDLMMKTAEMALASAQTIFHRTTMMAAAGLSPNAKERREFTRMGSEKVTAATASAQAMFGDWYGFNQKLATLAQAQWNVAAAMASFASVRTLADLMAAQERYFNTAMHSGEAALNMWTVSVGTASKGLKPIHSRASANAKRLMAAANGSSGKR